MYKYYHTVDNKDFIISVEEHPYDKKPLINMNYLKDGLIQTISDQERREDFEILVPEEIGKSMFGESPIEPIMMEQLKKVIEIHIQKYKRILQSDLGTYVAECIIIIETYYKQFLGREFDEKKKTFNTLFGFYYQQLPDKWMQIQ